MNVIEVDRSPGVTRWAESAVGWAGRLLAPRSAIRWLLAPERNRPSDPEGCVLSELEPRRAALLEAEDLECKGRLDTLVRVELPERDREVRSAEQAFLNAQADAPAPIGLPVAAILFLGEGALLCDVAAGIGGIPRSETLWELPPGQLLPILALSSGMLATTTWLAHEGRFATSTLLRVAGCAASIGIGAVVTVTRAHWAHVDPLSPEALLFGFATVGAPFIIAGIVGPFLTGWRARFRARRSLALARAALASVTEEADRLRGRRSAIAAAFDGADELRTLEAQGARPQVVRARFAEAALVRDLFGSRVVQLGITMVFVLLAALAGGCTSRTPAVTAVVVDTSPSVRAEARPALLSDALQALDRTGRLRGGDALLVGTTDTNRPLADFEVPRAFEDRDPDAARRDWLDSRTTSVVSDVNTESDSSQLGALRRVGASLRGFGQARPAVVLVGDLADLRRGRDGWFFETAVPSPERVVSTLEKTGELPDLAGVAVVACLPRPRTAAFSEAEERQAVAVFTAVTEQSGGTFKAVECSQPALQRALQEVP
jgi:hypothetical protein